MIFLKRLDKETRLFLLVRENFPYPKIVVGPENNIEFKDIFVFFLYKIYTPKF